VSGGADWSQLQSFEGTILPVVYDRYFKEHFASDIWQVFDGKLRIIRSSKDGINIAGLT
jgi:ATPase subunit of ABC transporter with duplicated ATPase domains